MNKLVPAHVIHSYSKVLPAGLCPVVPSYHVPNACLACLGSAQGANRVGRGHHFKQARRCVRCSFSP